VGESTDAPQPQTDTDGDADVHAFLIADVRGYTAFTQERGDEGGALLAARFAQVVRRLVEDHRGRVIELRGDEALVVFGSPRSAIRAAVALQQKFVDESIADPSLPLTVGIGLDAGEAVPVEGGFRGAALNVAGRLCSLARAGEVLASREIVHLARRLDGVRFTERGQAQLKGIEQPVHIVAVRSENRDAAEAIAPFVRSTNFAPARNRRWKVVAAAALAFAVLVALAVPLFTRGSSEITPNSIGVLDATSGELTTTIGLEDRGPGSIAASENDVWVTHPDLDTVTRIDRTDREIRDSIEVGEEPTEIAAGFDAVWVVESGGRSVSRISTETQAPVGGSIAVGNGPVGIAAGEGAVWVTNRFDGTVSRIDPDPSEAVEEIPVGLEPRGITTGFGSVWVGLAGSNEVARIDPATNELTLTIDVGNAPDQLAIGEGAVWVANTLDDTVTRISPDTNSVAGTIPVGNGPTAIALAEGTAWVANESAATLSRIEAGQTAPSELVVASVPQSLAVIDGDLWVSVSVAASPEHRGGTLRLVSAGTPPSLDPATAYTDVGWSLLHLVGDGLVAFESSGGTNPALVPDLAISIPEPTEGGRTYRFELRPEIRYSNGEVVTPSDFPRALRRTLRLGGGGGAFLYAGLVGGESCTEEPRTCDLSRGVVADDKTGTITFHLAAADPEFLYKLTLPFAHPVPASTPDKEQWRGGIPGTGPYMLEAPMNKKGLALIRNPYFHAWAPAVQPDGYVERIELRAPVSPRAQLQAVIDGEADATFSPSVSEGLDRLLVQFPAQIQLPAFPTVNYVVFNTDAPPFDDVEVRRALNLAVDRDRLVQIFGGDAAALPTCQQLPPNFPGYDPYCPYTKGDGSEGSWTAPDLDEAKRIVRRSGTKGTRVTFVHSPEAISEGDVVADYMVEVLDELGYDVEVRAVSFDELYDSRTGFHMALAGWIPNFPAASDFFVNHLACDAAQTPLSGFCDARIDSMMERALRLQADDPAASGALWAEIDREIVDQAPFLWLVNPRDVRFLSERVGNFQYSAQWGVLFSQLWVR
jgi:peptide/nickel transport system substrate-binding protein